MKYDAQGVSYLPRYQTTVKNRIDLTGIGVHKGSAVSMSINPADQNTGIVFVRTDNGINGT
ncbi:MAG: UDP-3-O-acyl-N-acetylglucosamine deacetylase, partial [Fimbriimonadaceae bacterium]|nr:UDP-3-O-acyl-N-acetylglucosamine deacetylase [Alphaproteobacteria bacterium]